MRSYGARPWARGKSPERRMSVCDTRSIKAGVAVGHTLATPPFGRRPRQHEPPGFGGEFSFYLHLSSPIAWSTTAKGSAMTAGACAPSDRRPSRSTTSNSPSTRHETAVAVVFAGVVQPGAVAVVVEGIGPWGVGPGGADTERSNPPRTQRSPPSATGGLCIPNALQHVRGPPSPKGERASDLHLHL